MELCKSSKEAFISARDSSLKKISMGGDPYDSVLSSVADKGLDMHAIERICEDTNGAWLERQKTSSYTGGPETAAWTKGRIHTAKPGEICTELGVPYRKVQSQDLKKHLSPQGGARPKKSSHTPLKPTLQSWADTPTIHQPRPKVSQQAPLSVDQRAKVLARADFELRGIRAKASQAESHAKMDLEFARTYLDRSLEGLVQCVKTSMARDHFSLEEAVSVAVAQGGIDPSRTRALVRMVHTSLAPRGEKRSSPKGLRENWIRHLASLPAHDLGRCGLRLAHNMEKWSEVTDVYETQKMRREKASEGVRSVQRLSEGLKPALEG